MCSDPTITYLKQYGYNVIRLPRANVKPLQLLAKTDRDLDPIGDIQQLLVGDPAIPLPGISADTPAANLSGQRSADLKVGIGLSILANLTAAMGGSSIGLDTTYQNAKTISFEFADVFENSIDIVGLDKFLSAADVNPGAHHVGTMLDADAVYVITHTIKSTKFIVEAKTSSGVPVGLNVPVIQNMVGGKLTIAATDAGSTKIVYQSQYPLVFGFRAVRLFYENGGYTAFSSVTAGSIAAKALGQAPQPEPLVVAGPFARVAGAQAASVP